MASSTAPSTSQFPRAVLFDLDGTLLDSAPDMLATANAMLAERGQPPIHMQALRPMVSKGTRAILSVVFPALDAAACTALAPRFLQEYAARIGTRSRLFDGVAALLATLEQAGSVWGIVTNKPERLARMILPQLGWQQRCAVLIGGDTLTECKPHPLPLLTAAAQIGIAPQACVYVGDDARDILSARAAGMPAVAALWGYRLDEDDPAHWQADVMVEQPSMLCQPGIWPRPRARAGSEHAP